MGPVWAAVCLVSLLAAPAPARERLQRIRGIGDQAEWLIERTVSRSPTASSLARRIDGSDVVVYVRLMALKTRTAQTVLLAATPTVRYLLISIHYSHPPDRLMELLGHELQHAVEIAEATEVRDDRAMERLFRRIGIKVSGPKRYETPLAQVMQARVRLETAVGTP